MGFCSNKQLFATAIIFVASGVAEGSSLVKQTVVQSPRVRSVVRSDARGRLVRTVVVSPRVIQPRVVETSGSTSAAPSVSTSHHIPDLVAEAAKKYDVDPLLVHSVIQVESAYNPYAVSPKGAQGLMQLMPGTARRFGVSNSFDPRENIEGGVRYLKYLTTLFPQDPRLALAAYNAGEGAVWKYNHQIPPYRETEHYVYKVAKKYGQAKRQAQQATPAPPAQTASAATPEKPAGPEYAPVRYFVDADGRLHMQTVAP